MYLTKQQVYDTVLTKLRAQGRASVQGLECAYRGEGGLKCAVGHLIPDNVYDPDWEGLNARTLPERAYHAMGVELSDHGFLTQLQDAHGYLLDGGLGVRVNLARWERRMREIADEHSLVYTPVEVQHG